MLINATGIVLFFWGEEIIFILFFTTIYDCMASVGDVPIKRRIEVVQLHDSRPTSYFVF